MARRVKPREHERGYTAAWYDYRRGEVNLKFWESHDATEPSVECFPYDWYFCLRMADWDDVRDARKARKQLDEVIVEYREDGDYMRLFMPYYKRGRDEMSRRDLIGWFREKGIEPLEADVDPVTRYLSDHPVKFAQPRVLWFDLENVPLGWVSDGKGGRVPDPRARILSVAWQMTGRGRVEQIGYVRNDGDHNLMRAEFEYLSSQPVNARGRRLDLCEADCIEQFMQHVGQADTVAAWNGDGHDEPLLKARCKELRLRPDWRMVSFLDYMALFKHPYYGYGRDTENKGVKVSYKLDNIAHAVLGEAKVEGVPGTKILDVWERDPELLERYNKQDVRIMAKLEKAKGYLEAFDQIAHMCNRFPSSRSIKAGNSNDGFLLKYGFENGVRFNTKQNVDDDDVESRDKSIGAFVMDPVVGLHDGVVGLDFGSLYPNIIRTFNISPEVCLGMRHEVPGFNIAFHGEAPNGAVFDMSKNGIVPAIVERTMAMREQYRSRFHELEDAGDDSSDEYKLNKSRSDGWKVVGNAMSGLLGSVYSRVYDKRCFEAITIMGRVAFCLVVMSATRDRKLRENIHNQLVTLVDDRKLPHRALQAIKQVVDEQKALVDLPPVAADTDCDYVLGTEVDARKFIDIAAKETDRWIEEQGGRPGFIRLDVDAVFLRVLWVAKKRYVAKRKGSDVPYVKGLEWVRTDGCQAQRDLQEDMFRYLLWEAVPTPEGAERIVRAWAHKLATGNTDIAGLTMTVGLAKDIDDYKAPTPPIQARVAKKMIEAGREVYPGMKIPYVVLDGLKNGPIEAVHVDDCDGKYDSEYYWAQKIYPATQKLLDAAFPKRKKLWKRLGKMKLDEKQKDMFEAPLSADPAAPANMVFRFRPGDEDKFEAVKEVFDQYPGRTPVEMVLEVPDSDVVTYAEFNVAAINKLVDEIEDVMGRRVYYGGLLPDAEKNDERKAYVEPSITTKSKH